MTLLFLQVLIFIAVSLVKGLGVIPLSLILVVLIFAEIPITSWLVGRYIAPTWRSRVFSIEYVLSLGNNALVVSVITVLLGLGLALNQLYFYFGLMVAVLFLIASVLPKWVKH